MATYRSVAEAKRVSEFEKIRKYVAMPWKGGYGRHSGHIPMGQYCKTFAETNS